MDDDAAYLALAARDARFDGRLFVGVTSTGIYCRPVCRVRLPRRGNCRFFPSAPQAEEAGFRPCLRCRPETAPGWSVVDASSTLADQAARWMDQGVAEGRVLPLAALAERLGVSDRHLRRIFQDAHGVTPVGYLTTQRLLLAKRLLSDTDLPVTDVALQSGFGSLRRFNAAFAERYRLTPSAVRHSARAPGRAAAEAASADETGLALRLAYRPPYDREAMLAFLRRRQVEGLEWVEGPCLRRTLSVQDRLGQPLTGWIEARFAEQGPEVVLRLAPALARALGPTLAAVRQGLDLDADPALVDAALTPALPMALRPGLRVPGAFEGFEAATRVILGQQVTVAAARTLTQRLVSAFGAPVDSPWPGVCRAFPSPRSLADADPAALGRLGIVRQRVGALQALARAAGDGLPLHRNAPLEPTLATLRTLPGIGEWTVQLIAMRCLDWPDAFPASDLGVLNALGHRDAARAQSQSQAWRPWRAYAVMQLWTTLE